MGILQYFRRKKGQTTQEPNELERIASTQTTDEFGNLLIDIYYNPLKASIVPKESKPVVVEDYNLGRGLLKPLHGFFSPSSPKVTVVGKYLNPEDFTNTVAHEEFHWSAHKNNAIQSEDKADRYAFLKTGIDQRRPYVKTGISYLD